MSQDQNVQKDDRNYVKHPSTAKLDREGNYVPDPLNQPGATADSSAHDLGPLSHPTPVQGYCPHGHLGADGCVVCHMKE